MNLVIEVDLGNSTLQGQINDMNDKGYKLVQVTFDRDGVPIFMFWERVHGFANTGGR